MSLIGTEPIKSTILFLTCKSHRSLIYTKANSRYNGYNIATKKKQDLVINYIQDS